MVFGHIRPFGVEKTHERVSGTGRYAFAATIPPVLPERQPRARRARRARAWPCQEFPCRKTGIVFDGIALYAHVILDIIRFYAKSSAGWGVSP